SPFPVENNSPHFMCLRESILQPLSFHIHVSIGGVYPPPHCSSRASTPVMDRRSRPRRFKTPIRPESISAPPTLCALRDLCVKNPMHRCATPPPSLRQLSPSPATLRSLPLQVLQTRDLRQSL